eukprot:scaffold1076_cov81-Cylindrotheca_fusiformis.AAC.5
MQQFTRFGQNRKSKNIHLQGSTCNNSPDLGKIARYVDDSDLPMLWSMFNNSWSKNIHLQGSTCNNSPDLGKIARYVDDSDLPMLCSMFNNSWSRKIHRQGLTCDNSPDLGKTARYVDDSDLPMLWSMFNNSWFDGRLLEQEDPSPRVDVRQFTRFGQNCKSKKIHLQGSTCDNLPDLGKIARARRSISKCRLATIQQIWAKSQELMPALWVDGQLLEQKVPSPRVDAVAATIHQIRAKSQVFIPMQRSLDWSQIR